MLSVLVVLNLGFGGYKRIMENNLSKTRLISRALEASGYYTCLSNVHKPKAAPATVADTISKLADQADFIVKKGHAITQEDPEYYLEGLPVVSFRFSDDFKAQYPAVKQAWIQLQLRGLGWIVPK